MSSDDNLKTIIDALEYYNLILLQDPGKPYSEMFLFVKNDIEHESRSVGTVLGILKSGESQIEQTLNQHKRTICASLKTYKTKLEALKKDVEEKLHTEPQFPIINQKINAVESMISKM